MASIYVNIPGHSYPVIVEPGLLSRVGRQLSELTRSQKVCIVTDSNVGPLFLSQLQGSLEELSIEPIVHTIPAGEANKTIEQIAKVYDTFLPAKIDRSTPVLALGGGVIGDMAGFVAATILRGVPFVQIPTTLLSMVDASVGGKTGVDHAMGKNLIGAFHQPIAVYIDPLVLKSLPPKELRSGLAECIKHECIRDTAGFASLEQNIGKALALDSSFLTNLVAHNVQIKARVVEADPFEQGERAHLNFGHTFGHAIELVANYTLPHGFCVGLGMCAASYVSMKLGLLSEADRSRIVELVRKTELPTSLQKLDVDAIVSAMSFDKKVRSGKLRFMLLDRIGHCIIRDDVPVDLVKEAVETLRG